MKSLVTLLSLVCAAHLVIAQQPQNPCINLPGGTGFVNDYSSCDAYFSCINFAPFETRCPLPFLFNPNGRFGPICDWPFNVNCQPCPEQGVLTIAHPYFCQKYTQCINGISIDRECAPGTAYSRSTGSCVVEEATLCDNVNTCGKLEGGTGNAPSTKFCEDFIICYNGEPFGEPIRCPTGLRFDSKHMRCSLAKDAVCYPGTITSSSLLLAPNAGLP
ncbi:hypothetical protein ACKWTF_007509 [Chironomus riparius]